MRDFLNIPTSLCIGFQKKDNSADGNLAFVVYLDEKNVLKQEKSFNKWRDDNIPVQNEENVPTTGFIVHNNVSRRNNFSGNVEKVRIYDPRGFEFEISISNFTFLLSYGNIIDLNYTGECVYCWSGTELILLPTKSQDYKKNIKNQSIETKKVTAKDLIVSKPYLFNKSNNENIYLGRFYINERYRASGNIEKILKELNNASFEKLSMSEYCVIHTKQYVFLEKIRDDFFIINKYITLPKINKEIEEEDRSDFISLLMEAQKLKQVEPINFKLVKKTLNCNLPTCIEDEYFEYYVDNRFSYEIFDKKKKRFLDKLDFNENQHKIIKKLKESIIEKSEDLYCKEACVGDKRYGLKLSIC